VPPFFFFPGAAGSPLVWKLRAIPLPLLVQFGRGSLFRDNGVFSPEFFSKSLGFLFTVFFFPRRSHGRLGSF